MPCKLMRLPVATFPSDAEPFNDLSLQAKHNQTLKVPVLMPLHTEGGEAPAL